MVRNADKKMKGRSTQGASLPLALLLFLVCSLLASIVLAASTTAVGSFVQLNQMDQRYYSVTSAAELLKSKINGSKFKIEVETEQAAGSAVEKLTGVKIYGNDGLEKNVSFSETAFSTTVDDYSLSEWAALCLLMGKKQPSDGYSADEAKGIPNSIGTPQDVGTYTLSFTNAPEGNKLNVSIGAKVSSVDLTLTITSPRSNDPTDKDYNKFYSVALGFDADVDEVESERTVREASGEKTIRTRTVSVVWMASDIMKAGA